LYFTYFVQLNPRSFVCENMAPPFQFALCFRHGRREIFCARKEKSKAGERRKCRENFEKKEEKEKSREGGARKNGSTVEAFACKALSESRSDGVVVPRLLNLFEIRVSWSIKPPFNQPPARLKVSSLPTTWCALRARTPVHVDPFYDDSTDVSKTNLPLPDFSSFTSQNNL